MGKIHSWKSPSITDETRVLMKTEIALSCKVEGEYEDRESVPVFKLNAPCTHVVSLLFMTTCMKPVCCHPS